MFSMWGVVRPLEIGPSVLRVRDPNVWAKEDHRDGKTEAYAGSDRLKLREADRRLGESADSADVARHPGLRR
jgi:hypothetical protein